MSSAVYTSTTTGGNWSSGTTWVGGFVPNSTTHDVVINGPVTCDGSYTIGSLTINSGKKLTISNSLYTLSVNGTFTNNNSTGDWLSLTAGTFDLSYGSTAKTVTFGYTPTTIGGTLKCDGFTVSSSKIVNVTGSIQTDNSSQTSTISGTVYNSGTVIFYGPFSVASGGIFYNNNSVGTSGGTLKIENSISCAGTGKIMGAAITNNIIVTGRFSSSQNFGSGNDLNQSTITVGDGVFVSGTCGIVTNPIKVKKITFNNSGTASSFYVNSADVTVWNLDGGYSTGANAYININNGRTLTIEGQVTSFAQSSSPNYFFRGGTSSTVYFASGLDSYTGWTLQNPQIVPTVETAGAYPVSYPGNLKIRTHGNLVKIGSNIEGDFCGNDLYVYGNLEIFASTSGGTVTTDATNWSPASYEVIIGSASASSPGTFYFTRDASGSNVNVLTLNLYHRIEKNTGTTYPASVYMGNASSTINVYYENATYPAVNNFDLNYSTDITTLSNFYGIVNYLGTTTGINQIAIPVSYFNMTINRNTSSHIVQLKEWSISVRNNLTMTQGLADVNDLNIDLLTTGQILSESNTNRIFCSGCTSAIAEGKILSQGQNISSTSTSYNYAQLRGIGVEIQTGSVAPGVTTINRGFRIRSGNELEESVKRYIEITPTINSGLNATLTFHYWDAENNSPPLNEATLTMFRDNTGSDGWVDRGGTSTPGIGDNTVALASIDAFSSWTAGKKKPCTAPGITTDPVDQTVCVGSTAAFTTVASGSPILTYQWQVNDGGGWSNVGTSSNSYTTPATTALMNGYLYQCIVSNGCGSATTASATLTVVNSPSASAGGTQTICFPGNATVSGASSANGTILWTHDGAGSLSDETTLTPTYTAAAGDIGNDVTLTMTVTNSPCPDAVAYFTVPVRNTVAASVTISTSCTSVCSGSSASFTATPTNGGTSPSYQWQVNGSNVGSNSSTYSSSSLSNGDQVTCIMTSNAACVTGSPATSNTLTMTVSSPTLYYVNDNSTTGDTYCSVVGSNSNSGLTSTSPKLSLRDLWDTYHGVLKACDIIYVDAGTYSDGGGFTNDNHNLIIDIAGITILGAGINVTIFDHNNVGANSDYFMCITADNVTVQDMTVREYDNQGSQYPGTSGQAITVSGAAGCQGVQLVNLMMQYNGTSGASGGNAAITILANSNVTISGGGAFCNYSGSSYGGGIDILGANTTVHINNLISAYNEKDGAYGGGVLINGDNTTTNVYMSNCRIANNIGIDGGGIRLYKGKLTVRDCIIESNSYYSSGGGVYGGGLQIAGGTADISRSAFNNNTAARGGAISVYTSSSTAATLRLDSCSFSGNTGSSSGPDLDIDMYSSYAISVTCNNTTFSASTIRNNDASLTLTNCGNPTTSGGGTTTKVNTNAPTYTASPSPPAYSGTCGGGITLLPVELISFKAEAVLSTVQTSWETYSETNNDYFTVERSKDGIDFLPIAVIDGAGNSNDNISYSYIDNDPFLGTSYYRLRQTDFDGMVEVFEPVTVTIDEQVGVNFIAYPNPAQQSLNIAYEKAGEKTTLEISNLMGHVLFTKSLEKTNQTSLLKVDVSGFPEGVYFVKFSSFDACSVEKIVIQ